MQGGFEMQVCPVCAGQGCNHCGGKGYHGINQQLGFVTINKNTGAGISVLSGIAGAFILPMLTGGFDKQYNTNRKIRNAAVGFLAFTALGALGSYGAYQIQN